MKNRKSSLHLTSLVALMFVAMWIDRTAWAERTLVHEGVVNASAADLWKAWTTSEGFASWAVAKADIDFRLGGEMRSHYNPKGELGDDGTIINRIIAFEPERMLSIQNIRAPKGFKNAELFQRSWTVITFEPITSDRTRVRFAGLGFGEGEDWDEVHNKFSVGNAHVLKLLQKKFNANAMTDDPQRVMSLLGRLAGGEWIHENRMEKSNSVFRVRNLIERGPDGQSLVMRGWLGDSKGMHAHSAGMIWVEPAREGASSEVRFQNLSETGGVARGAIRLIGCDSVEWDWNETASDGQVREFRVTMSVLADDQYTMKIDAIDARDGTITTMVQADFKRVEHAPAEFTRLAEQASPSD